jgi:hypothetical protein
VLGPRSIISVNNEADVVHGRSLSAYIIHLEMGGCRSLVSEHQIFDASPSTSSAGLFAPKAPSANVRSPILTGSKNVVAADVARAACQIVALTSNSSARV